MHSLRDDYTTRCSYSTQGDGSSLCTIMLCCASNAKKNKKSIGKKKYKLRFLNKFYKTRISLRKPLAK